MAKIAMKFGGTSVADLDRIRHVAGLVKTEVDRGHQVAVVVSAMAGETNKLVGWINAISPLHDAREYDTVVAAGEQITAGLLAVALGAIGVSSRSWLGWQIPIETSAMHGSARIEAIPADLLNERLAQGQVAVIAGFQGIARDNRVSTLGRGGSDTSAVAVAAAIKADRCDIYTDVDGVYTTDPRIVPKARRMEKIAFEEMLEMASLGAKVLQTRSVEIAMLYRVPVRVLSTFDPDAGGTLLCDEEDIVEKKPVTGIAYSRDEAKISLMRVPDRPGVAAAIFRAIANENVSVDMIVQNVSHDGRTDLSFTLPNADMPRLKPALDRLVESIGAAGHIEDDAIAKISLIGAGMKSHPGVAAAMFEALATENINIEMISTSSIRVSCVIRQEDAERAVRAVHARFDIEGEVGERAGHVGAQE